MDTDLTKPPVRTAGRSLVSIAKEAAARADHFDMSIPRFDGAVVVRYKRISTKSMKAAGGKGKSARASNAKLLADACLEVFVRVDGELRSIAEDEGLPNPVRYDGNLADLFELRGEQPAEIVFGMYRDEVALGDNAKRLYDWQVGADLDDLGDAPDDEEEIDDLVGEEDAAT
ncbi:MAG: hypothetical protein PGN13_16065 [Patulibacter minatonensis]